MSNKYRKLSDLIQVDDSSGRERFYVNGEWSFELPYGCSYSIDAEYDGGIKGGISLTSKVKPMVIREDYSIYKNPFNVALEPHYDFFGKYGNIIDCKYDNRFLESSDNNRRTILIDEDDFYVDFYRSSIFPFGVDLTIRVRGSETEAFNFSAVVDAESQEEYNHHVELFDSIANSIQRECKKSAKSKKSSSKAATVSDPDYIVENNVLLKYIGHKTDIVIPDGVNEIADNTFSGLDSIETLYVPEGVKSIGRRAFENCTSLREVTLPDSLEYLGDYAFVDCHSLTSVTLGKNLTAMESSVFSDCFQLQDVVIPPNVKYIDAFAFKACQEFTQIVIPNGVEMIGFTAFAGCSNLEYLYIPKSVKTIMDNFMGVSPFAGCSSLVIHCPKGSAAEDYAKSHNLNYEIDNTPVLLTSPKRNSPVVDSEDDDDDYSQPSPNTFFDGTVLNDIEVEEGATEIEADAYSFDEDIVFAVIPEGVEEIGDSAFYCCKNLEYVKLPDSVLRLQENAFDGCEKLPYLIIPEGCQVIGADCFTGCKAMTDLYIPASVTEIGEDAFFRFTGDCDILFHVKRGSYAEQYAIENDLTYTNSFDYSNLPSVAALVEKRSSKSDIEFPEGITVIEEDSHSFDRRSTCLLIPEGVEEIQKEAFYGCEKLQYVKLPTSLRILGEGVFRSCEKLIRVDFPEGCRSIGADCFTGCDAMTDLYIPASVTEIGEDAFFHYPEDITLHVKRGSYAERYAIENNLKYVLE